MAIHVLTISNSEAQADMQEAIIAETGNRFQAGTKLMKFIRGLMGGAKSASIRTEIAMEKATGTATFASVIATDVFTINGTAFTCVASGATGNQFNVGADDTESAANAVTAINASSDMTGIVVASSVAGVVTLTAARAGKIGNAITLATSDATITVSAARLSGGTDGAVDKTHYYGSAS